MSSINGYYCIDSVLFIYVYICVWKPVFLCASHTMCNTLHVIILHSYEFGYNNFRKRGKIDHTVFGDQQIKKLKTVRVTNKDITPKYK